MKRKKVVSEITRGILFCLLLTSNVQLIGLTISEPSEISKITEQTQSISSESERCGTMTILDNLKRLTLGIQSEVKALSSRPTDPGGGIDGKQHILPKLYNTTRFVLHWTNGTDGGSSEDAPLPKTDANGNGIPDVVENWGEIFEYVWDFLINVRGFPAPPIDEAEPNDLRNRNPDGRYDVFIYSMKYLGYAYPEQYPNSPSYSYIGVMNTLGKLGLRQIVAAHEFFHAIQFVYDCAEESWWMETTAVYMEDEVYPDVNHNYGYLPFWFEWCDTYGLESIEGLHEYGNFIFAKRLSEDFGDEIIKEIWQEMNQSDGLLAIDNVLNSKNFSLFAEFSNFITANFFLEDMYVDGTDYRAAVTGETTFNGVWLEYQYDATVASNFTEINMTNVNWDCWMDRWATDYITLKLDPTKQKYKISFDGLDTSTNYLVKLVTKKGGNITEQIFQLDDKKDGNVTLSYNIFDNVTLIIANAGNTATNNPSWRVVIEILETIPIYDVAVINVEPSTYSAVPGWTISIAVTVENKGNIREESFNVSTWWGQFLIETRSVINLAPGAGKTLNITWIIPPELNGSEMIWANATITPEETNLANNKFENGILKISIGIHDIAITEVYTSKTVIGQSKILEIIVSIANQGNYTENFNLIVYANTTSIGSENVTLLKQSSKTLVFSWNTTGFVLGNYTISAEASVVPGEIETTDNVFVDGLVTIRALIHDIAITQVRTPKSVVGQGYSMLIKVEIENQGETTETFNLSLFANANPINSEEVTLMSGSSKILEFIWNTTGFAKGNYTISAYAEPVPDETNTEDNSLTGDIIIVTIPGDVDGDFDVDIYDIVRICVAYGSKKDDPKYQSNLDINDDGKIDIYDIAIACSHYGKRYP